MSKILFHVAFPVTDLDATKKFYVDGLGCTLGRESSSAVILGLAGHQCHKRLKSASTGSARTGQPESPNTLRWRRSIRTLEVALAEHTHNVNVRASATKYHAVITGSEPIQRVFEPLELLDTFSVRDWITSQSAAIGENLLGLFRGDHLQVFLRFLGEKDLVGHADLAFSFLRRRA